MTTWAATETTTWRVCATCGAVMRHDDGRCMYDPASPVAKLVRRDLPGARDRVEAHDPQTRLL